MRYLTLQVKFLQRSGKRGRLGWRVRWLSFDERGFHKRVVRGHGKADRDPETVEERVIVRCGKRRH